MIEFDRWRCGVGGGVLLGRGFGLLEPATASGLDIDERGNADDLRRHFAFTACRSDWRSSALEPRKCVVDFDWRVLLTCSCLGRLLVSLHTVGC